MACGLEYKCSFFQWMSVTCVLIQVLVTKRRLDGHLTPKLDAASRLNMAGVLAMKITLTPRTIATKDALPKVCFLMCFSVFSHVVFCSLLFCLSPTR